MALREELEKRRDKLRIKLEPYYDIKRELEEVEKALAALGSSGPSCGDWCSGCSICRRGPEYR